MAGLFEGRTDVMIKNRWTLLSRRNMKERKRRTKSKIIKEMEVPIEDPFTQKFPAMDYIPFNFDSKDNDFFFDEIDTF